MPLDLDCSAFKDYYRLIGGKQMGYKLTPEEITDAYTSRIGNSITEGLDCVAEAQIAKLKRIQGERLDGITEDIAKYCWETNEFGRGRETWGGDNPDAELFEHLKNYYRRKAGKIISKIKEALND